MSKEENVCVAAVASWIPAERLNKAAVTQVRKSVLAIIEEEGDFLFTGTTLNTLGDWVQSTRDMKMSPKVESLKKENGIEVFVSADGVAVKESKTFTT